MKFLEAATGGVSQTKYCDFEEYLLTAASDFSKQLHNRGDQLL